MGEISKVNFTNTGKALFRKKTNLNTMKALALVIGNGAYPDNEVKNPGNDSEDFGNILTRLGFIVRSAKDVDVETFEKMVSKFGKDLNSFDVGLFYYAGHGIQVDGENFLTAVNTNFESETSVKYSSVTLNKVLDYMDRAPMKLTLLFLTRAAITPLRRRGTEV